MAMKKIKLLFASFALIFATTLGSTGTMVHASPVFAVDSSSKTAACGGLTEIDNKQDCNNKGAGVDNVIHVVVNLISYAAGIAAIIMILISGFKYITSGGDSSKVGSAKNTLIYALIGIAVAVSAQVLVRFVVSNSPCTIPGKENYSAGAQECS
jgi:hypothetical protein